MPIGPSQNLPLSRFGTSGISRAQNTSVTHFGRQTMQDSRVSMNQIIKDKNQVNTSINKAVGLGGRPVTSVFGIGQGNNGPTTSIARPTTLKHSQGTDEFYDETSDEKRYDYIRRMIKQKQATEEVSESSLSSGSGLKVKSGGGFKAKTLKKQLYRMIKASPATYKSMGEKERKYIIDMFGKRARAVTSGTGFGRAIRIGMKNQIERDRKAGQLSTTNARLMKKMVDDLHH